MMRVRSEVYLSTDLVASYWKGQSFVTLVTGSGKPQSGMSVFAGSTRSAGRRDHRSRRTGADGGRTRS
jgi:hypothetical protein